MSRVTHHLGFGLTYASTFMHPFYTARLLNSLDHITNGRIAFNVITSQRRADYANYGYDELVDIFDASVNREPDRRTAAARCRTRGTRRRSAADGWRIGCSTRSLGSRSQSSRSSAALGVKAKKACQARKTPLPRQSLARERRP